MNAAGKLTVGDAAKKVGHSRGASRNDGIALSRRKNEKKVSSNTLKDKYNHIQGKHVSPAGFTRWCKLHGLEIKKMWIYGRDKHGVKVSWDRQDEDASYFG